MNLDDLTIGQARELAKMFGTQQPTPDMQPFEIGKNYLLRTVTMIDTGRVIAVGEKEIVLEDAAWIADTGRFADAVQAAEFGEVEPFPTGKIILNRSALIDAVQITKLPRVQK